MWPQCFLIAVHITYKIKIYFLLACLVHACINCGHFNQCMDPCFKGRWRQFGFLFFFSLGSRTVAEISTCILGGFVHCGNWYFKAINNSTPKLTLANLTVQVGGCSGQLLSTQANYLKVSKRQAVARLTAQTLKELLYPGAQPPEATVPTAESTDWSTSADVWDSSTEPGVSSYKDSS